MQNIIQSARNHSQLRERLKAAFQLDDEDQTLIDTLGGESDFAELCAEAIRVALDREAMANAVDARISQYTARRQRHLDAARKIRALVAEAMMDAGERKITTPDLTILIREGRPELLIDESKLWPEYYATTTIRKVDKAGIRAAIDQGLVPDGVQFGNASPVLTVRTK